jgi:hypothetical protein
MGGRKVYTAVVCPISAGIKSSTGNVHTINGGSTSITVIEKVHEFTLPLESPTKHVTSVVPREILDPGGWEQIAGISNIPLSTLSDTIGGRKEAIPVAIPGSVRTAVTEGGHVIVGASVSRIPTIKLHDALLLAASTVVHSTIDTPKGKSNV